MKVCRFAPDVAHSEFRAFWLWFQRQTRCSQAVCTYILAWLCMTSRGMSFEYCTRRKYSPSTQQAIFNCTGWPLFFKPDQVGKTVIEFQQRFFRNSPKNSSSHKSTNPSFCQRGLCVLMIPAV